MTFDCSETTCIWKVQADTSEHAPGENENAFGRPDTLNGFSKPICRPCLVNEASLQMWIIGRLEQRGCLEYM